ncbi:hypothetical protein [Micromonospora rubida]
MSENVSLVAAIAGVAIALLALIPAALSTFYARRQAQPQRKKLAVSILTPAPLLNREAMPGAEMEVVIEGKPVKDPHIFVATIENVGRLGIKSEDFDRQRPITFTLGVPIVSILEVSTTPQVSAVPNVQQDGWNINVGPDLIPAGQSIIIQALTSGEPNTELPEHHLADTIVERAPESTPVQRAARYLEPLVGLASTLALGGIMIAIVSLIQAWS